MAKAITPEYFVERNPDLEEAHQTAFFCWARNMKTLEQYPELEWMHAIPNGGKRDAVTAAKLKQSGVKAGVADVCLPVPSKGFHGLYIEFKKPSLKSEKNDEAGASEEQLSFKDFVVAYGYKWAIAYSYEEAKQIVIDYVS